MTELAKYDAIVVGAGLSGSVIARHLAENHNQKVIVLEKRSHIAGNMFDYVNEYGIRVQQYGPHIFHTKSKKLYDYMVNYGSWTGFHLRCSVKMNGKFTPSPFNFQTIDDYFPEKEARELKEHLLTEYSERKSVTIVELLVSKNTKIRDYANFLFENDYKLYTAKQWGITTDKVDVNVLKRVPVLLSYENGYFDDLYEIMPVYGYTPIISNILNHHNISVKLEYDACQHIQVMCETKKLIFDGIETDKPIVYTGPIDELLQYKYGALPYRSLRFEYDTLNVESYQSDPVVAYPQVNGYTRITEYKKLPVQNIPDYTTIVREYPITYIAGSCNEPFYPINTNENMSMYEMYRNDVSGLQNFYLCGRLGDYQYYNMDCALERALEICTSIDEKYKI